MTLSLTGTLATSPERTASPSIAETLAGGCVRSAATSAASTCPWACASGVGSAASGFASASTRASASATGISATRLLLSSIMSRFAAALLQEADALDAHATLECLHHVVDGEAGDGDCGQRLHLHSGPASHLDACAHGKAGQFGLGRNIDGNVRDGQG